MTENHFDDDILFESRKDEKNQYSTFIEELEQSTEKLMNEVFNSEYVPQINHEDLHLNQIEQIRKNNQILFDSAKKKNMSANDFNNSKRSVATRCTQKQLTESFVNFLVRNQKWKQRRINRAKNQHNRKEQQQLKKLTFVPNILKASRQKVIEPIYERCVQLQKQKQKKIAMKRIEKQRQESQKQSQYTFQPTITTKAKNRTLEQYLQDKQQWNQKKQDYIQNEKLWQEAKRNQECIFRPILIAKPLNRNSKKNDQGTQRVEDRLLRSLQKSIEKKQSIQRNTQTAKSNLKK